jgi:hypothetical protein
MGSYLESYGAIEDRRARNIKLIRRFAVIGVAVLVVAVVFYAIFKNFSQEQQVKTFLTQLRNRQYQDAYRMWGCTEQTPCRDYPFPKFMEDWGPESPHADASAAKIGVSQTCGNGVVIRVDYPKTEPMALFVDRESNVLSFAPWPECPGKHWHFGAFLRSLFSH